ncbi:MAG: N-acetylglucosamine kinase [bacterium]
MYYLGIDGGGSKTSGILCDAKGKMLKTLTKGAGNIAVLAEKQVVQLLNEMVFELLEEIQVEQIKWATCGFAGAGREKEKNLVGQIIREIGIRNFTLMTDAELLYYAIHGEKQGLLIASGTGSVCLIKNKNHEFEQLGGWGYLLGDEGSGYDIGRNAVRNALREQEMGRPLSKLTHALLTHCDVDTPRALMSMIYAADNPQNLLASFAQIVGDQALQEEPNALRIVDAAAKNLVELALTSLERMESEPPHRIALSGGVLNEPSVFSSKFKRKAQQLNLDFHYFTQEMPPAAAGILYSLHKAGEMISESLFKKLRSLK